LARARWCRRSRRQYLQEGPCANRSSRHPKERPRFACREPIWVGSPAAPRSAAVRRLLDRRGGVAEAIESAPARLQCRLSAQNLLELLVVLFLVDHLAARKAVDPGAQLGNAVFVRELHLRLPREQFGKHVFTEGEIGDGGDGPRRHGDERADHDPEGDWSEPRPALVDRTRAIRAAGIMLCRSPTT